MMVTNDENATARSKAQVDGSISTPSTESDNEADPTIRQLLDEIRTTREEMASMRSENEKLRSTVEGLTPISANTKQSADEGQTSKQQGKQPVNHPVRRTSNPIEPPPGYEQFQSEQQVIVV